MFLSKNNNNEMFETEPVQSKSPESLKVAIFAHAIDDVFIFSNLKYLHESDIK